ncbi:MAG: hypothetical protein R6U94_00925 [Nitriliruptoraceae bacterium]
MELIVVAVLTVATVLTGMAVTEPARGTWHPAPSDREGKQWSTRHGDQPVRHRRQQTPR